MDVKDKYLLFQWLKRILAVLSDKLARWKLSLPRSKIFLEGKLLAAHSVSVAADSFLRTDAPTVLWLVPSQTIRDQTLATLEDRVHPNRRALADRALASAYAIAQLPA